MGGSFSSTVLDFDYAFSIRPRFLVDILNSHYMPGICHSLCIEREIDMYVSEYVHAYVLVYLSNRSEREINVKEGKVNCTCDTYNIVIYTHTT